MLGSKNKFMQRVSHVLKTEGIKGVFGRIKDRFRPNLSQYHCFVQSLLAEKISNFSFLPALDPLTTRALERSQRFLSNFEFKQLTASDIEEIDELTKIDPWKIPTSASLEKLKDGWHCYVAKYQGGIVACGWINSGPEFLEPHIKRSFTLDEGEVFGWRGFCIPSFRGKGVIPWLNNQIVNHLALTAGVKRLTGLARINNPAMWRTLQQTGWSQLGRVGFIEIFGIRLHYILGRKAFNSTKKRFFIQRQKIR